MNCPRCHGSYTEVGDIGYGSQGFPSEAQSINVGQILKLLQLGGGVPLTEQGKVFRL